MNRRRTSSLKGFIFMIIMIVEICFSAFFVYIFFSKVDVLVYRVVVVFLVLILNSNLIARFLLNYFKEEEYD